MWMILLYVPQLRKKRKYKYKMTNTKKESSLLKALYFIKAIVDLVLDKVDPNKKEYKKERREYFEEVL